MWWIVRRNPLSFPPITSPNPYTPVYLYKTKKAALKRYAYKQSHWPDRWSPPEPICPVRAVRTYNTNYSFAYKEPILPPRLGRHWCYPWAYYNRLNPYDHI